MDQQGPLVAQYENNDSAAVLLRRPPVVWRWLRATCECAEDPCAGADVVVAAKRGGLSPTLSSTGDAVLRPTRPAGVPGASSTGW